jgi:putative transcriptional regulator
MDSDYKTYTNHQIRKSPLLILFAITVMFILLLPCTPLSGLVSHKYNEEVLLRRIPESPAKPNPRRSIVSLSRGKLLVASRGLKDPNFSQSVVLIIEYDRHGTVGLIINRPTGLKLATLLPEIRGLKQREDIVYIGGPVNRSLMMVLIHSGIKPEESSEVLKNVYVTSSRKLLEQITDKTETKERFRVYAGLSGWTPGQLENEIMRGGWHILQADAETIFDKESSDIWPELIRRSTLQWVGAEQPYKGLTSIAFSNNK